MSAIDELHLAAEKGDAEVQNDLLKRLSLYYDLEISEHQIKEGLMKDARKSLVLMKEKYGNKV